MILTILHFLQWVFTAICVPLLGLLLYALFKDWRARMTAINCEDEYKRGYTDGYADGFDAALLARVMDSSCFEGDTHEDHAQDS